MDIVDNTHGNEKSCQLVFEVCSMRIACHEIRSFSAAPHINAYKSLAQPTWFGSYRFRDFEHSYGTEFDQIANEMRPLLVLSIDE